MFEAGLIDVGRTKFFLAQNHALITQYSKRERWKQISCLEVPSVSTTEFR